MNTKRIEKRLVLKANIKRKLNKLLISIIIFLIGMILVKKDPSLKVKIKDNLYEKHFPFIKIKKVYDKYFGKTILTKKKSNIKPVFQEQLSFQSKKKYNNGVELKVIKNYQVPIIESGIIVFIGEKEKYGTTAIVEQVDGIDTFYSNINIQNKKLYDYVEKGEIIGQTKNDKLYLIFQKDGKYLDYQKYI